MFLPCDADWEGKDEENVKEGKKDEKEEKKKGKKDK